VEQLNKLEKKYLELFLGSTSKHIVSRNYTYVVSKEKLSKLLTRYSPSRGFVEDNDMSGIPLMVEVKNILTNNDNKLLQNDEDETDSFLHYRIPATADINIYQSEKLIGKTNIIIPQLGRVGNLSLKNIMKAKLSIEYYPAYGSIKRIYKKNLIRSKK
jgi:hypothetical protein